MSVWMLGKELIEQQSKVENVDCLPTLTVSDIERHCERDPFVIHHKGQVAIQLCSQPTNEVTYFRAVSSIVSLPTHLKPYVPLFCNIVTKMGAGSMDYQQLSQQIELKTGALEAGAHLAEHHSSSNLFEQSVLFTSYCLNRNVEAMLHLWIEIFNSLSLADTTRLQTLIQILASEMSSDLSDCGHQYAMTHAASTLQSCSAARELMSGLTQVDLMKNLAELSQHGELIACMKDIAVHVLSADNMRCCVTSTPDNIDNVQVLTEKFIETLPTSLHRKNTHLEFFAEEGSFTPSPSYTHCHFPFQVNYMACSLPTVPYCHPHFASLRVLAKLLTMKYLHREIREKGGAYGGGAMSQHHGLFHFYSYRDPNLQQTLDRFAASAVWAANGEFTDRDIDEAKLAVFSQVDSPVPPGRKGVRYFLYGIDDSAFQSHREQLLEVGRNGIVDAAQTYLIDNHTSGAVTVLGPENALTSDSQVWTVKKHE